MADAISDDLAKLDGALTVARNSARARRELGEIAHRLMLAQRYVDALRIFDAIVDLPDQHPSSYCNPLWVVQHDNTGLALEPARAKRYLAACLPHAPSNPAIHLNAAGVYAELGEHDAAMAQLLLAARGKVALEPHLGSPLFAPLRDDPRWLELSGAPNVEEPSLLELAAEACALGELAHAVPALVLAWRDTRSPRIADILDHVEEKLGVRVGYGAEWIETALTERPEELAERLHETTRTLRDGRGGYAQKETSKGIWLVQECDDPRFGTALLRIFRASPAQDARKRTLEAWQTALDMIVGAGDVRMIDPLDRLATTGAPLPGVLGEWLMPRLVATIESLLAQTSPPELDGADAAFCSAIEAGLGIAPRVSPATRAAPRARATESTGDVVTALVAALDAASGGDASEAVAQLLVAWQRKRAPRIADLVDLASARADESARRDAGTLDQKAWIDRAMSGALGDLPDLLRTLLCTPDDVEGAIPSAERIWALKGRNDPRIATALIAMLETPPFLFPMERDNGVWEVWKAVIEAFSSLADARAIEPIAAFAKRVRGLTAEIDDAAEEEMYTQSPVGRVLEAQMDELASTLARAVVPALSEEETRLVSQLEAAFAVEAARRDDAAGAKARDVARRAELLQAIADAPSADEPRLAYADWLDERGDAYGELIRLQIARAHGEGSALDAEREAELLETGSRSWMNELGAVTRLERYERGFPVAVRLDCDLSLAKVIGHVGWATVRRIECDYFWSERDTLVTLLSDPIMRSLRELTGIPPESLVPILSGVRPPLELVGFDPSRVEDWRALLAGLERLAELRTIVLELPRDRRDAETFSAFLESPLCRRLASLVLTSSDPAQWMALWNAIDATELPILHVGESGSAVLGQFDFELRFTRDDEGRLSVLHVTHGNDRNHRIAPLMDRLRGLPPSALTRFVLEPHRRRPTVHALEALRESLARFPRLAHVSLPEPEPWSEVSETLVAELRAADDYAAGQAIEKIVRHRANEAPAVLAERLSRASSEHLRLQLAFGLAYVADEGCIPALREVVRRPSERSAQMAALVLGKLRAREAVDDLVALLEATKIDDAPAMILQALVMLGDESALPAIRRRLEAELTRGKREKSASPARRAAIGALGMLGDRDAREIVIASLTHGDVYDRRHGVLALGMIGAPADRSILAEIPIEKGAAGEGRALLARLLLTGESPSRDEVKALGAFVDASARLDVDGTLLLGAALLALADRAQGGGPAWRAIGEIVVAYCARASEDTYLRLVDSDAGFTWNVPAQRYWLSLAREIQQRWGAIV